MAAAASLLSRTRSANKFVQGGGHCGNKLTTEACSTFEEGLEWGCGDTEGCCMK
ncbi:MAG TPA: hypothetical protein VGM90_25275 [Kofleriaceae bacterium]